MRASGRTTDRSALVLLSALLALFYAGFAAIYFGGAHGNFDPTGHAVGRDFVNLWTAGVLAARGEVAAIFDIEAFHRAQEVLLGGTFPLHFWSYPPQALFFALPFGQLPYLWGYAAWTVATLALYLVAAGAVRPAAAAILALAPATYVNVIAGQNGFLTAALMIGGLRLLPSHKLAAGALFGLLTFKPQLGLLLPVALLAAREFRAIAAAAVVAAALAAASIAVFGMEIWQAYVAENARVTVLFLDQGTGPFVTMMPSAFMSGRVLGLGANGALWLQLPFTLLALWCVWRSWRGDGAATAKTAVLLIAAFVASPYAFNYDMPSLSFALVLLYGACGGAAAPLGGRLLLLLAWLLPLLVMPLNGAGVPIAPLLLAAVLLLAMRLGAAPSVRSPGPEGVAAAWPAGPGFRGGPP